LDEASRLAKLEAKEKKNAQNEASYQKLVGDESSSSTTKKKKKPTTVTRDKGYNPLMPSSGNTNGYR
jgi:hypothetical protein